MTLKAAKKAMDAQYESEKALVVEHGRDGMERWKTLTDKMKGVVDACIYDNSGSDANGRIWRKAQEYKWKLIRQFWVEVVEEGRQENDVQ